MDKKLCEKCRPLFEESYPASARHVLKDGELRIAEAKVIEAAKALFIGYTSEDSFADWWKTDDQIDHRLYALFLKMEALLAAEEE